MKIRIKLDKWVSTNDFYKLHWGTKVKLKEKIISNITFINKNKIEGKYKVDYKYNSRVDVDNNSALIKVVLDHLRREQLLDEDYNSVFIELNIKYDKTLEKNTCEIIIKKTQV